MADDACPLCQLVLGNAYTLAKHLRRRHGRQRLLPGQEDRFGLHWCSCQTYWATGGFNRHYQPNAPVRSNEYIKRCVALGLDPNTPPPRGIPDSRARRRTGIDTPIKGVSSIAPDTDIWPESPLSLSPVVLDRPPLAALPGPAYVLTARVWRELPRQFWPAWRAAVRQTFERYLTATDDERPSVISMLLA